MKVCIYQVTLAGVCVDADAGVCTGDGRHADRCVCVCVDADGGARTPGDTLTEWNVCVDTDGGVCRCRWRCVYMC